MKVSASFRASSLVFADYHAEHYVGGGLGDRAAVAGEGAVGDCVAVEFEFEFDFVAAAGVYSVEGYVGVVDFVFEIGVDVVFG